MEVRQVDAKQGWQWIVTGFFLFRQVPLVWILLCTTLLLIAATLSLIPLNDEKQIQEFGIEAAGGGELQVTAGGRTFRATALSDGKSHQRHPHRAERAAVPMEGRQSVVATMPGRVVRVLAAIGDRVAAGQAVVVLEAMKMENEMRAPKEGVVREVRATPGAAIDAGAVLVVID